jgi:hypothetical protein
VRAAFEGSVRVAAAGIDEAGFWTEAAFSAAEAAFCAASFSAVDFCEAALADGVDDFTVRDACWSRDAC